MAPGLVSGVLGVAALLFSRSACDRGFCSEVGDKLMMVRLRQPFARCKHLNGLAYRHRRGRGEATIGVKIGTWRPPGSHFEAVSIKLDSQKGGSR